jgi:DNA-binding MarR family transcriptional regulator
MKLTLGKTNYRQICSILKLIYQYPNITRKELGEILSIDRAMVTHILKYLIADGWLVEQNASEKRLPLTLVPTRLYAAGVEIQPEYQQLVVSSIDGKIVFKKSSKKKITDITSFIEEEVKPVLKKMPVSIAGLAVAVPGICNAQANEIIRSVPFEQASPVKIETPLDSTDIPVFVENDVRCWGWGKVAFEKQYDDFLVLLHHFIDDPNNRNRYKRISAGAAFFSKGTPLEGAHRCAGELPGFFRIDEYRSTDNYIPYSKRLEMKHMPKVQEKFIKDMAITASYLSTIVDVQTVYVTGFENIAPSSIEEKIQRYMNQYHFYPDLQQTIVKCEKNSKTETALGACGLVFENLFVKSCENEVPQSRLIKQKNTPEE